MSRSDTGWVRYSECDPQGVVFNANYLAYFEWRSPSSCARRSAATRAVVERGVDLVVAEARMRYLAPLRFDDEFELLAAVAIWARLDRTALALQHGAVQPPKASCATSSSIPVAARKHPSPDRVRAGLEPHRA